MTGLVETLEYSDVWVYGALNTHYLLLKIKAFISEVVDINLILISHLIQRTLSRVNVLPTVPNAPCYKRVNKKCV